MCICVHVRACVRVYVYVCVYVCVCYDVYAGVYVCVCEDVKVSDSKGVEVHVCVHVRVGPGVEQQAFFEFKQEVRVYFFFEMINVLIRDQAFLGLLLITRVCMFNRYIPLIRLVLCQRYTHSHIFTLTLYCADCILFLLLDK